MELYFDDKIKNGFERFYVGMVQLKNVKNIPTSPIDELRESIFNEIKSKYTLESLKMEHTIRVNRDFFWRLGIDPTKKRPAAEALIRRVLGSKPIPRINIFVDLYNLMSIKHELAIAGFDHDRIVGNIKMCIARSGQEFLGIGMKNSLILSGKEIIIIDEDENIIAIYPYRDANHSKLTKSTQNILLLTCGVPGFPKSKIESATIDLFQTFKKYLDASGNYKIFQSN